jgi:hypothetical protein
MAKNFKFNLLEKKTVSVLSEATSFLNSYAKYIIVLTQLLVLVVFFVKIILDQQVIDLKEAIDEKNQIILVSEEMIQHNNLLAEKTQNLVAVYNSSQAQYQVLTETLNNIPESVNLSKVELHNDTMIVFGKTYEAVDIKKMQLRLLTVLNKKVTVEKISKEQNIYYFEIKVDNEA